MIAISSLLSISDVIAEDGHSHTVRGLHFSHPLIAESPSPDTKVRLDYIFLDVDGEIEDEELGEELGYNVSMLYHINESFQGIIEFDGEAVLSGEEEGESVLNMDPGMKLAPFNNKDIRIGLGAGFPLTNDEEFKYRIVASLFYHFPY